MGRQLTRLALTIALCLAGAATAAGQGDNAQITGTVKDESGAVVPGVSITITDAASGYQSTTVTDAAGEYRVRGLRPGSYVLVAELAGFSTVRAEQLSVRLGQAVDFDVELKLSTLAETVTVSGESPLVDLSSSRLGGSVTPQQIESLPQLSRSWLSLSAMVPGVRSNEGMPTAGAQSNRRFVVNVDAADTSNSCCRGANGYFSTDAIAEFEVLANQFDAQYGRSVGTITNVVTKSGTNEFRGGAFGYFRDTRFNATDSLTGRATKKDVRALGGTVGGPLVRDKAHFFVSFEDQLDKVELIANTPDPRLNTPVDVPFSNRPWSVRYDQQINPKHRFFVRHSDYRSRRATDVGGALANNAGWITNAKAPQVAGGWTWVKSALLLNELRASYVHARQVLDPISLQARLVFPSATLYAHPATPQVIGDDNLQVLNTLSLLLRKHSVKIGTEIYSTRFSGTFPFEFYGQYFFNTDPADFLNPSTYPRPIQYNQGVGDPHFDVRNLVGAVFIQDDWKARDGLTLNLGLRYDVEFGANQDHSYRTNFGNPATRSIVNNVSPRFGFTYDVRGTGKTVVKGGAGIFYDQIFLDVTMEQEVLNGQKTRTASVANPVFGDPFGGRPIEAFLTTSSIRAASNPLAPPRAVQYSVGVTQQISNSLAIEATYIRADGWHEIRDREVNVFRDDVTGYARPYATFGRPDPRFGFINLFESSGTSQYDALQIGVNKRYAGGYSLQASYTLSKSLDDGDGAFQLCCDNPFDIDAEWGRSLSDQRHRLVLNSVVTLPWDIQLSGIFWAMSGRAYRNTFGGDANGDGLILRERFNRTTGVLLERNSNTSDPVVKVDLRLAKSFRVYRSLTAEGTVEVFNLFKRGNFDPNTYGPNVGTARYRLPGASTVELYLPRNAQLGLRFRF